MKPIEDQVEMAPRIGLTIYLKLENGKTALTVNGMTRGEGPERIVHSTYCLCEPTPEALRALAEMCDRFADRMTWDKPKPEGHSLPVGEAAGAPIAPDLPPDGAR